MDNNLKMWRESGNYLPDFLKDFHDQKDFFKMMHETMKIEEHEYAKDINFVAGQCYVIDCFLYKLASYGYTIQKSRANQNFDDLDEAIMKNNEKREAHFMKLIMGNKEDKTGEST